MRGSTGLNPAHRLSALVLGCALALGLTACSDSSNDDGPSTAVSDPPASGYSVQNSLALLPSYDDDGPLLVVTADLDAATEQSGLQRPTSLDDDAAASWLMPLSGVSNSTHQAAAVFVPFAAGLQSEYLFSTMIPFREEVGWDLLDAASFAERQTPPQLFTVVEGDFDSSTFPAELPEVADGVVTAGEGDDFAQDLQDRTGARPFGAPLRMAIDGSYLAAAPSTSEVEAWLDGSYESLADDTDLVAVAEALDNAGAVSAVLSSGAIRSVDDHVASPQVLEKLESDLAGAIPADPFSTVGIGWAAQDGESVITVAFKFASDDAADDAVPVFEEMFTNAPSLMSNMSMSELYSFQGVEADGSVAVVTLAPGESGRINSIYQALMAYDLPFIHE